MKLYRKGENKSRQKMAHYCKTFKNNNQKKKF